MNQTTLNLDAHESNIDELASPELLFLDDATYVFVGGGDAANGY